VNFLLKKFVKLRRSKKILHAEKLLVMLKQLQEIFITHANGSGVVEFLPPFVCPSVFQHNISKTDAAKITKRRRNVPR